MGGAAAAAAEVGLDDGDKRQWSREKHEKRQYQWRARRCSVEADATRARGNLGQDRRVDLEHSVVAHGARGLRGFETMFEKMMSTTVDGDVERKNLAGQRSGIMC